MSVLRQPQQKFIMPEDYLAIEEQPKERSESWDGETFVMFGGSIDHVQIMFTSLRFLIRSSPESAVFFRLK